MRAEPAVEPVGGKGTSKIVRQVIQTSAEPTVELAEPPALCFTGIVHMDAQDIQDGPWESGVL